MKKKILSVMLAMSMVVLTTACGLKTPDAPSGNTVAPSQSDVTPSSAENKPSDTPAEPEVTLVYAEVNPLDTIVDRKSVV